MFGLVMISEQKTSKMVCCKHLRKDTHRLTFVWRSSTYSGYHRVWDVYTRNLALRLSCIRESVSEMFILHYLFTWNILKTHFCLFVLSSLLYSQNLCCVYQKPNSEKSFVCLFLFSESSIYNIVDSLSVITYNYYLYWCLDWYWFRRRWLPGWTSALVFMKNCAYHRDWVVYNRIRDLMLLSCSEGHILFPSQIESTLREPILCELSIY